MSSPGIQTTSWVRVLVLPTEPDVRLRDVPAEVQGDDVLWYRDGNADWCLPSPVDVRVTYIENHKPWNINKKKTFESNRKIIKGGICFSKLQMMENVYLSKALFVCSVLKPRSPDDSLVLVVPLCWDEDAGGFKKLATASATTLPSSFALNEAIILHEYSCTFECAGNERLPLS